MIMTDKEFLQLVSDSKKVRKTILEIIHRAQASHIASALSVADLLLYLYADILRIDPRYPKKPGRDRLVLSKGWAASALYSVLAQQGFFPVQRLKDGYCSDGSPFIGITTLGGVPGVEATTGSMGHGLSLGIGMAIAAKRMPKPYRVFVVISDGELDEGSTWEGIFFAGHHQLDNLTVIIDCNKFQAFGTTKEVLDSEPIAAKFEAFKWSVERIDGHDFRQMEKVFSRIPTKKGRPSLIVADTVKGKGISFMENANEWHYRSPNDEQYAAALKELT